MSASGNLPPQAYTREVLVKAYEWLSTQTPAIRDRASSADAMVTLYLQARRRHLNEGPNAQWESPSAASIEAFKEDLRNLAEGLRQFDDPRATATIDATMTTTTTTPHTSTTTTTTTTVPLPSPPRQVHPSRPVYDVPPARPVHVPSSGQAYDPAPPSRASHDPAPVSHPAYDHTPPVGAEMVRPLNTSYSPSHTPSHPAQAAQTLAAPGGAASPTASTSQLLDPKSQEWVLEVQRRMNLSTEADALRAIVAIGFERLRDLLPRA